MLFLFEQSPILTRGSSVVECRTRNLESPGSNPTLLPFRSLGIFVLFTTPQSTQLYKWVPGGHVSDLVVARNCCMTRMLPGEAELVSEWTGLSGRAKSVKHFERSNGLETALYKNIPLHTSSQPGLTNVLCDWIKAINNVNAIFINALLL